MNKAKIALIIGVIAIFAIPLIIGAILTSNTVPVTVQPNPEIALTLSVDKTTVVSGETITLTATLTNLPDQTVTFLKDGSETIGTNSSISGIATLNYTCVNLGTEDITMNFTATIP